MGLNEQQKKLLDEKFQQISNAVSLFYTEYWLPRLHHLGQKEGEDLLSIYHVVRNTDEGNWHWPAVTVVREEFVLEVVASESATWAERELVKWGYTFEEFRDRYGLRRHTFTRPLLRNSRRQAPSSGGHYTSPQYDTRNKAILAAWVDYKRRKSS